jgi:hypothetical protein
MSWSLRPPLGVKFSTMNNKDMAALRKFEVLVTDAAYTEYPFIFAVKFWGLECKTEGCLLYEVAP